MIGKILISASFVVLTILGGSVCGTNGLPANAKVQSNDLTNVNQVAVKSDYLPSNSNSLNRTSLESKPLFVIVGEIGIHDGKIEVQGDFWGHDATEDESKLYPDNKVSLDIMNCAGYIGSATTTYKGVMRKVTLQTETIAPNAIEKIKQCSGSPNSEIPACKVFAVSADIGQRESIKIIKTDATKLYTSLRKDIKSKRPTNREGKTVPQIRFKKKQMSMDDDIWTDLDGDGKIDLVLFYDSPCLIEKDTCTWIFRLVNGRWQIIDSITAL